MVYVTRVIQHIGGGIEHEIVNSAGIADDRFWCSAVDIGAHDHVLVAADPVDLAHTVVGDRAGLLLRV